MPIRNTPFISLSSSMRPSGRSELKITVDVSATGKTTEILGADILADIDGRITEISVTPDGNTPFKLNLKGGAFRLRSMYVTKAQLRERDDEPAPTPEEIK